MPNAEYFRDLAEQCRHLAQRSREPEMSAELNEIADALIVRADEMEPGSQLTTVLVQSENTSCPVSGVRMH